MPKTIILLFFLPAFLVSAPVSAQNIRKLYQEGGGQQPGLHQRISTGKKPTQPARSDPYLPQVVSAHNIPWPRRPVIGIPIGDTAIMSTVP